MSVRYVDLPAPLDIRLCVSLNAEGRLCGLSFAPFAARNDVEELLIHRAVLLVTELTHRVENKGYLVEDLLRHLKCDPRLETEYLILKAVEGQQAEHFRVQHARLRGAA